MDSLIEGFWFVPSAMLLLTAGLALILLNVDRRFDPGLKASIGWAYSGGPEGARSLLSTIAGSMITAASVTFSLAAVALSIASEQYGARVLRNFMRDHITQVLLGTFVSAFLYSVLVVRSIRGSDYSGFVPAIATTVAIVLALISLVMLIYFVHHVSTSIQASHIVKVISEDMHTAIPKLYPSGSGEPIAEKSHNSGFRSMAMTTVRINDSGYLQIIDLDSMLKLAEKNDWIVEVLRKPGDHVVAGGEISHVWAHTVLEKPYIDQLVDTFSVAGQRSPSQDIRFQF
jgi:uncharacterized membrane protein